MNKPANSKRIEIRVSPVIARALGLLAEISERGESKSANHYSEEDLAGDLVESAVMDRFKDLLGCDPGVYFARRSCVARREGLIPHVDYLGGV